MEVVKNSITYRLTNELSALEETQKKRSLAVNKDGVDFYSNDYLGFAFKKYNLEESLPSGASGSRLISGNHSAYQNVEAQLADLYNVEACLIYPSGYSTNLGLFSCIAKKEDVIIYDELCHASIRDGIRLNLAKAYKFEHNNLKSLEQKLKAAKDSNVFVVTESVFSMDGDEAPLEEMLALCKKYNAELIVDEAHALGFFDLGKAHCLGIQNDVFATVITFSKGLGLHGGAVLGSSLLKEYLVNFSRPFIYTTGLPPKSVLEIGEAFNTLTKEGPFLNKKLRSLIAFFKQECSATASKQLLSSDTPIQAVLIPSNEKCKEVESSLLDGGFLVKAILHPTVPKGSERLRIILHALNTKQEISQLLTLLDKCLV